LDRSTVKSKRTRGMKPARAGISADRSEPQYCTSNKIKPWGVGEGQREPQADGGCGSEQRPRCSRGAPFNLPSSKGLRVAAQPLREEQAIASAAIAPSGTHLQRQDGCAHVQAELDVQVAAKQRHKAMEVRPNGLEVPHSGWAACAPGKAETALALAVPVHFLGMPVCACQQEPGALPVRQPQGTGRRSSTRAT
jgi:hypothetical protein